MKKVFFLLNLTILFFLLSFIGNAQNGCCQLKYGGCGAMSQAMCEAIDGTFLANGDCVSGGFCVDCSYASYDIQGCCSLPSGGCGEMSENQCCMLNGYFSEGSDCVNNDVCRDCRDANPDNHGCCELVNGGCGAMSEKACCLVGGLSFSEDFDCVTEIYCRDCREAQSDIQGCCSLPGGGCGNMSEKECCLVGGEFTEDFDCVENIHCRDCTLADPGIQGCCLLPNGGCGDMSDKDCCLIGGEFNPGVDCDEMDCDEIAEALEELDDLIDQLAQADGINDLEILKDIIEVFGKVCDIVEVDFPLLEDYLDYLTTMLTELIAGIDNIDQAQYQAYEGLRDGGMTAEQLEGWRPADLLERYERRYQLEKLKEQLELMRDKVGDLQEDGAEGIVCSGSGNWWDDASKRRSSFEDLNGLELPIKLNTNVFPNPSNGSFVLDITSKYSGEATISLFNLSGQQLEQINFYLLKGRTMKNIALDDLPSGLYYIRTIIGEEQSIQKLIISK